MHTLSPNVKSAEQLSVNDLIAMVTDVPEQFEEQTIYRDVDGQMCVKVTASGRFCDLDHIAEMPSEFCDPCNLCEQLEACFTAPLAFVRYRTGESCN